MTFHHFSSIPKSLETFFFSLSLCPSFSLNHCSPSSPNPLLVFFLILFFVQRKCKDKKGLEKDTRSGMTMLVSREKEKYTRNWNGALCIPFSMMTILMMIIIISFDECHKSLRKKEYICSLLPYTSFLFLFLRRKNEWSDSIFLVLVSMEEYIFFGWNILLHIFQKCFIANHNRISVHFTSLPCTRSCWINVKCTKKRKFIGLKEKRMLITIKITSFLVYISF